MKPSIKIIAEALDNQRNTELSNLLNEIDDGVTDIFETTGYDISATAPEHRIGFRAGHNQAKEQLLWKIRELITDQRDIMRLLNKLK